MSIHVFRILQEALNNVARHAEVEVASVHLNSDGIQMQLVIEDHGRGLPEPPRLGVGLAAMRERAELIGGLLTVSRTGAVGTTVTLVLPLDAGQEMSCG